jgi:hypothetical protein
MLHRGKSGENKTTAPSFDHIFIGFLPKHSFSPPETFSDQLAFRRQKERGATENREKR